MFLILGDMGAGVVVNVTQLSEKQRRKMEESNKKFAINEFVSSFISLRRSLPDVRDPK